MPYLATLLRVLSFAFAASAPTIAIGQAESDTREDAIEEIVVTGTGNSVQRRQFETPQTVTQYTEEDLRAFSSSSQADILTQLPGVSAEGGGGKSRPTYSTGPCRPAVSFHSRPCCTTACRLSRHSA